MGIDLDDKSFECDDDQPASVLKKTGFDLNERLTLKHNAFEAERYRLRQNQKEPHGFAKSQKKQLLPNQIRAKIKDVYDEEDEDENENILSQPIRVRAEENPLFNALDEDEKRLFMQKQTVQTTQMQQKAGKMEALMLANTLAKEVGLSNISRKKLNAGMNQATFNPKKLQEKAISEGVVQKLHMKGQVKKGKIVAAAKGIKKIEQMAGSEGLRGLRAEDAVALGENKIDEKKMARLILEKSGQNPQKIKLKKGSSKVSVKNFEKAKQKERINLLKQKKDEFSK